MANKAFFADDFTSDRPSRVAKLRNHVSVFNRTLQKSEMWIGEIHREMRWANSNDVYRLLRAVLHVLRDQISTNEAAQFAAQLPLLLRGTFYECWNPHVHTQKGLSKEEFLEAVRAKLQPAGALGFDLESCVVTTFRVIRKHVSAGEMADVVGALKPSLRKFFAESEKAPAIDLSLV